MLDDSQWVKVEFYARVPTGQVMTDIDPAEVAANLLRAFGFAAVAGLTVADATPPASGLNGHRPTA